MSFPQLSRKTIGGCLLALLCPLAAFGQVNYAASGLEYGLTGELPGDQVFPDVAIDSRGGWVVWEDNYTDGDDSGISARRLDSSLSGYLSPFRVNQLGADIQERPRVAMLNDGGSVFVWQGGPPSAQRIYARFMAANNTWKTGDVLVNTYTNHFQLLPAVAKLTNGNVVVAWGSFNQENAAGMQGVYLQRLSPAGVKLGSETLVNSTTAFNQRTPCVAGLNDGRFVVVWVSEQQRFENSVDLYARIYSPEGVAASGEILINSGTNVCANPAVAPSTDGGFLVAWSEKNLANRSNNWDIISRPISSTGVGQTIRRVNTYVYGDQLSPRLAASGSDYLVTWTSMAQDGSREGVYGQYLRNNGEFAGGEFLVNTVKASQQLHPAVASDNAGRFLVVWTSFIGGTASFDLFAQRYASILQPLPPPEPPYLNALSSSRLGLAWPYLAGYNVASYEIYMDGAVEKTAAVTNNMWTTPALNPASTHTFRLAFVLADGRRSPLSAAISGTTWGVDENFDGLPDDWQQTYWGADPGLWPAPNADSDGDGVSNRNEFLAGTNPADANSVLRLWLQPSAQGLYLKWNTQPGLIYQVQKANGVNNWVALGEPRFATGYLDTLYVGGGDQGFYRLVRLR